MNKTLQCYQEDAELHGSNKALILYHLRNKVEYYRSKNMNCHFGRYWYYTTAEKLTEIFTWLSRRSIARCIQELEEQEVIWSKNLNFNKSNHTKHYTVIQHLSDYKPKHKIRVKEEDREVLAINQHLVGLFEGKNSPGKKIWNKITHKRKIYPQYDQFGLSDEILPALPIPEVKKLKLTKQEYKEYIKEEVSKYF